ncbi:hypothetical protein HDU84_003008 [Entophlyctis sp. JEL0112]|nr:hypothetical protein HDU84_003008 [Entophlyctis sp. JEL0112]
MTEHHSHSHHDLPSLLESSRQTSHVRVISGSPDTGLRIEFDHSIDIDNDACPECPTSALFGVPPKTGVLSFDVLFGGHRIGSADAIGLSPVQAGAHTYTFTAFLCPKADDKNAMESTKSLVSKFIIGEPLEIEFVNGRSAIVAFDETLRGVKITSVIPQKRTEVVQCVVAKLPFNFFTFCATGVVTMNNPFDCTIDVLSIKGSCFYDGMLIGHLDASMKETVVLPGNTVCDIPPISVKIVLNMESVKSLIDNIRSGKALVEVQSTVRCGFGGYELSFDYWQNGIPLKIRIW